MFAWRNKKNVNSLGLKSVLYEAMVLLEGVFVVRDQGPDVQSIVSLTSSLVVKMLTVLVVSNSQVFLLKKM